MKKVVLIPVPKQEVQDTIHNLREIVLHGDDALEMASRIYDALEAASKPKQDYTVVRHKLFAFRREATRAEALLSFASKAKKIPKAEGVASLRPAFEAAMNAIQAALSKMGLPPISPNPFRQASKIDALKGAALLQKIGTDFPKWKAMLDSSLELIAGLVVLSEAIVKKEAISYQEAAQWRSEAVSVYQYTSETFGRLRGMLRLAMRFEELASKHLSKELGKKTEDTAVKLSTAYLLLTETTRIPQTMTELAGYERS